MKMEVVIWGRDRDGPDPADLNATMVDVFDGVHCPFVSDVESHSCDVWAMVVSSDVVSQANAQTYYDTYLETR